jgi:hypothetical protein
MDLVRQAAYLLSTVADLPPGLRGDTRQTIEQLHSLIVKTETHLVSEANWVQARSHEFVGATREELLAYVFD